MPSFDLQDMRTWTPRGSWKPQHQLLLDCSQDKGLASNNTCLHSCCLSPSSAACHAILNLMHPSWPASELFSCPGHCPRASLEFPWCAECLTAMQNTTALFNEVPQAMLLVVQSLNS